MAIREAASCDGCGRVAHVPRPRTHPDGWWKVFGPEGSLDFCCRACLVIWLNQGDAVVTYTQNFTIPGPP